MLRQAQKLQQQMMKAQEELENASHQASAGGGVVTAVVSGKMRLDSLAINPEVISPDDVEMLQDLVLAAVNEALEKSQKAANDRMGTLTGGLNIPGLG
ncbi:MAG: YbaB/EbfC family nucleoid-associated protein [SAR202 cluster bacterium]|jgi:hypothetical protein|nr:YbaB/EbfC family nucleoid-associated protein [SAR202 cluster bacterium]